jgi:hypothetical protein
MVSLKDVLPVPVDRLKTDVRLCGQYFELRDYDQDIQSSIGLMQARLSSPLTRNACD